MDRFSNGYQEEYRCVLCGHTDWYTPKRSGYGTYHDYRSASKADEACSIVHFDCPKRTTVQEAKKYAEGNPIVFRSIRLPLLMERIGWRTFTSTGSFTAPGSR